MPDGPEDPATFRFRLDPDRKLVVQYAAIADAYQGTGLATDIALRIRAMLAPELPTFIQGTFTDEGLAWAEHMRDKYGWALM